LREALAAADHDFILAEPASKSKRLRDKISAVKRRGSGRSARRTRRYAIWVAGALAVAAICGILVNALTLQKTRHPAPLFGRTVPAPRVKEPSIAETARAPAQRSAPKAAPANPAADKPVERAPHPAPPAAPGEAGEQRQHDPISQLLKTPAHEPAAKTSAEPSKAVMAAQRALIKLGYVLKADGVAGAATRQAIERYERDHKLAVRGELTPALMRQLSAASGVPMN
jgi:hypothetical protein